MYEINQENMSQDNLPQDYLPQDSFSPDNVPPKPQLNWVDLTFTLAGIAFISALLIGATFLVIKAWSQAKWILYGNALATQLSFGVLLLSLKFIRGWEWADFGWRTTGGKKFLANVIGLYFLALLINFCYAIFVFQHGAALPDTDVYIKMLENTTWHSLLTILLLACVMAPLIEETIFRGIIFGSLQTYFGKWTSAALSSAVFAGLHFQAYGFFPRFVLGMFLVYLYDKYKSLYPAVALHTVNNAAATLLAVNLQM